MVEIIEGYAMVIGSWINFLFELNFGDGTTVGGILLAVCVLSLIIRFIFNPTWAGQANAEIGSINKRARQFDQMQDSIDYVSKR